VLSLRPPGFAFGFHSPPPKVVKRVEPDLSTLGLPYPCGIVILEIGINERGEVVSSCVSRGVRADFDRAAQAATRKWRIKRNARLPRERGLPDGSYLSTTYPSARDRRRQTNGDRVRVIDYRLTGVKDAEPLYRLATTLLDPAVAPGEELAALYHERWEIETALDELKTHLRGAHLVLRSKTPDLVRQECYGLLLAHFALRGLMHEAAVKVDADPDRLSFLHAVRVLRRKLPLAVARPPSGEIGVS
jgi:IS4 transposase